MLAKYSRGHGLQSNRQNALWTTRRDWDNFTFSIICVERVEFGWVFNGCVRLYHRKHEEKWLLSILALFYEINGLVGIEFSDKSLLRRQCFIISVNVYRIPICVDVKTAGIAVKIIESVVVRLRFVRTANSAV